MSVWAEVAGKHEKRKWPLERENGERDSDKDVQFQAKPRGDKGGW